MTIDEVQIMLDEVAIEIPKEFYNGLNGGILLMPEIKTHPNSINNNLLVMGQYNTDVLGRYITIYYGSFEYLYGHLPYDDIRAKYKDVLIHEFTHHLEALAGERDLEIEDAMYMEKYMEDMQQRGLIKNTDEKDEV